jgi:diadenosine tetraphosphate (Ap4A) HIT family hydrolase
MRTGYEMPACEAANATRRVVSQFLPGLKPSYRNREFTGFHLHFHGSPHRRGETGNGHEMECDNEFKQPEHGDTVGRDRRR